jgi:hypothetical protein
MISSQINLVIFLLVRFFKDLALIYPEKLSLVITNELYPL